MDSNPYKRTVTFRVTGPAAETINEIIDVVKMMRGGCDRPEDFIVVGHARLSVAANKDWAKYRGSLSKLN